ncbi:sugar ABC transporter ATP-binding protein [Chryseolinea sp. H1M3-3]|uniref:sugar ABC transporter ATP-binding protein n=1 Tax=Chryseolinea sp. H1M3-3 TaxID=3034144 RepID=UPI0023EDC145|nr:sugar ABC transporter ATP-binding protein [Chryseolinea sp. H1M3-3]
MASLLLDDISKQFPGVKALSNVSMEIQAGEIHALCGENGAGKSTLMNILSGNLQPDGGRILLNDKEVLLHNPQEAFENGIAIVYQHLSLVDSLSVAENIFANLQPRNRYGIIQFNTLYEKTNALLRKLKLFDINPRTLVAKLSPAEKQMVEIAKALSKDPSILILDEPTASLTDRETKTLFEIIQTLKTNGVSIIYISHRLNEIFLLSDRVSILKDGQYQGTFDSKGLTKETLINKMVGRELKILKTSSSKNDKVLLEVKNISGAKFKDISLVVHQGEIVGLAGLMGAGRTEIARAVFGMDEIKSGEVRLRNKPFHPRHPAAAIRDGVGYVTEERKNLGLFPGMSIQDNVVAAGLNRIMPSGYYNTEKVKQLATTAKEKLGVVSYTLKQPVINLSGGNQQKVMLAKWLLTNPDVLIVDEPTHGIDVGAKSEIYQILKSLAEEGKGILIISSELPELIGLCDKIIVIKNGKVAGELSGDKKTEEQIIKLAT